MFGLLRKDGKICAQFRENEKSARLRDWAPPGGPHERELVTWLHGLKNNKSSCKGHTYSVCTLFNP